MRETNDFPACEHTDELISFVYGELSESESQHFKLHLNTCQHCSMEFDSFGEMRDAITSWKYESLNGVLFAQEDLEVRPARRKSAAAALREFFNLSPLWMKGAIGFAMIVLCVLVFVATGKLNRSSESNSPVIAEKTYTQQQVDAMMAKVRAEAAAPTASKEANQSSDLNRSTQLAQRTVGKRSPEIPQSPRSRRPLTRSEREQLAADLRLTTSGKDETVDLIGDRINE